jgi:hypothetical protein
VSNKEERDEKSKKPVNNARLAASQQRLNTFSEEV